MSLSSAPVALNGRFSGTLQPTGTQTVAFHLFDAIIRESSRDRPVVVFADPRYPGVSEWTSQPNTTFVSVPFQDWSRLGAQLWEQLSFPRLARAQGCDVMHSPITTCPFFQAGLKTVVTLHDLNFYHHPEWYSFSLRLVLDIFALPGIKRAHRVVTISDYVRTQAVESLSLEPERVVRIYNGTKPAPELDTNVDVPVPTPYILAVGSLQPHKNLPRLIRAHQMLRNKFPELELWIVGRPQPRFAKLPELASLLTLPGVRVLGYLSEAALAETYRNARVFCFPSLEEGFGLPLLEAMQARTIVLTSNVSCLPEIGGPACLCVDPYSESAIASGISTLLRLTPHERTERIENGLLWTEKFTWKSAAIQYLDLYNEIT